MNIRQFELPLSAMKIVGLWSAFDLLIVCMGLDDSIAATGDWDGGVHPLPLFCGGLFACWLMVATWWIIGGRPGSADDEQELLERDRVFRLVILSIVAVEMGTLVVATAAGARLLGYYLLGAMCVIVFTAIYRQVTARRIGKDAAQRGASLDIQGLMVLTFAVAIISSICRNTIDTQTAQFFLTLAFGVGVGVTWLSLMLWMLARRWIWFATSVLFIAAQTSFAAYLTVRSPAFADGTAVVVLMGSLGFYMHAIVFFAALRAADYRLR